LVSSSSEWQVFESTSIDGYVKRVRKGTIFKTISGNIYEVIDVVVLLELELRPDVTVLTDGQLYKLLIQGVDEPLLCRKLNRGDVIETTIIGTYGDLLDLGEYGVFSGLQYGNIYKMGNGQIWKQTDFYINVHVAVMPKVTIWQNGTLYNMKVEGIDKAVTVQQIK
jgi:hypothetical protein